MANNGGPTRTPEEERYLRGRKLFDSRKFIEALDELEPLIGDDQWRERAKPLLIRLVKALDVGSAAPPMKLRMQRMRKMLGLDSNDAGNRPWEEVFIERESSSLERLGPEFSERRGTGSRRLRIRRESTQAESAAVESVGPFEMVERTPHLEIESDDELQALSRFEAKVFLDKLAPTAGEVSEPVRALAGSRVEMTLAASGHFTFESPPTATFTMDGDADRMDIATVRLQVVEKPKQVEGAPFLAAIFYVDSRPCGRVTRSVFIRGVGNELARQETPPSAGQTQPDPWALSSPNVTPPSVEIGPNGPKAADLTVTIVAADANDGRSYLCTVQSPHLEEFKERKSCPWNLQSTTRDLVAGFMKKFASQPAGSLDLIAELRGAGNILFEASPRLFQEAFWGLIDANVNLKTIAIITAEPFVPWELMIPNRWKNGTDPEERPALGVEFQLGRWTDTRVIAPSPKIQLRDSFVVAPAYVGNRILKNSNAEAEMVLKNYPGDRIAPANFSGIQTKLGSEGRSLVHFICHGDDDGSGIQTILLEEGRQLSSSALLGMPGIAKIFRAKRPVVFLNACKIGQTLPSMVGLGGFVVSFIKLGATAVIAPLWSVEDAVAGKIATIFYDKLKASPDTPLSEIFASIRTMAYEEGSGRDTYAAYCFYGDPFASLAN